MKLPIILSLFTVSLVASSSAALYTANFDSPNFSGVAGPIADQDGWTITDATPDLSFTTTIDSSATKALGLGGSFDVPAGSSVSLNHAYVENIGRITATFNFAIIDSTDTNPNRDVFGFSLNGSSGSLYSIFFTPAGQTATPDANSTAEWNAFYSVLGGSPVSLAFAAIEGTYYTLDINLDGFFTPGNTTTTSAEVTLSGGVGIPLIRTDSLALDPTLATTTFGVDWTVPNAPSVGDNFIGVDNLTLVPEPSSSLLLAIAGLGLVSRRRRA